MQNQTNVDGASDQSIVLLPCPFCGHRASVKEGFDIDCESTIAWISCSGCDAKYGPFYPDSKQDVIDWAESWNNRRSDGLRKWIKAECEKHSNDHGIVSQTSRGLYHRVEKQAQKLLDVPVGQ